MCYVNWHRYMSYHGKMKWIIRLRLTNLVVDIRIDSEGKIVLLKTDPPSIETPNWTILEPQMINEGSSSKRGQQSRKTSNTTKGKGQIIKRVRRSKSCSGKGSRRSRCKRKKSSLAKFEKTLSEAFKINPIKIDLEQANFETINLPSELEIKKNSSNTSKNVKKKASSKSLVKEPSSTIEKISSVDSLSLQNIKQSVSVLLKSRSRKAVKRDSRNRLIESRIYLNQMKNQFRATRSKSKSRSILALKSGQDVKKVDSNANQ